MAFADPQSINWKGTDYDLHRVSSGNGTGGFWGVTAAGSDARLDISHQYNARRTRRMVKLSVNATESDVFTSGLSRIQGTSCYLVLDTPSDNGIVTPSVALAPIPTLAFWLSANSYANATKFVSGEI